MTGNKFIKIKDKDILYVDHRGLGSDDVVKNIHEANIMIKNFKGQELYLFLDFRDVILDNKIMKFANSDETVNANKYCKKVAILGMTGLKKVTLNLFNVFIGRECKALDTEEQANAYLTS